MMSLEEKLRAYAAKGELVHLSIAFSGGAYHCNFAAASPAAGYASGVDPDPVEAIEKAFKAALIKPPRVSKPKAGPVTIEFTEEERAMRMTNGGELDKAWTTP